MFHLMWRDGIVLCGDPHAARVQMWPWTQNMLPLAGSVFSLCCSLSTPQERDPGGHATARLDPEEDAAWLGLRGVAKRACER